MQLTYYNNKSDKRYLSKNIVQIAAPEGHSNPVTIQLVEDTDIVHPTFKMADVDVYFTANYCYVDSLRRYYYIDKIRTSKGFAYLDCTVDVLMTYKDQIKAQEAVVSRQRDNYNKYQVDDRITLLNYECVKTISFPTNKGFDAKTQQFVLCTIGNTSQT